MADINNTFGLDASQAIRELGRLDTALDGVNASITQVQVTASGNIDTQFSKLTQDAKKGGDSAKKALTGINTEAQKAAKSVQGIGLGFKDVLRIVESQILFSAISGIKQGFSEAADAAAEFELQIARINAIAEDGSIGQFNEDVKQLARDLGRSLSEVGEASFEALQNDIGNTEDTFDLLRTTAQELALVTGGTLPQAVNSLSSVIKSYNLDINEAQELSGVFFGAINAGRITLGEFENSLGTITPLAREVGVDFENVATAIATITRSGTKANVATTQLRNVFNKLIKPTKELKQVYQDLGVEGFQPLVEQTGNFAEALQLITAGKTEQEVARLFNTIRGNLGVLNTLSNEGKEFDDVLKEIRKNSADLPDAIASIEATSAREAARNAAELEIIFTELGDAALDIKNIFTGLFLEVIEDSDDAKSSIAALTLGVIGLTTATKLLGASFKTAFIPAAAFVAGIVIGNEIVDAYEELSTSLAEIQDTTSRLEVDRLNALSDTVRELNDAKIDDLLESFTDVDSALNRSIESARAFNTELVDGFKEANVEIDQLQNNLLESFGDGRKRIIEQIGDAIKEIDAQIIKDTQAILDIGREIEDFGFERALRDLEQVEQVQARIARTQQQLSEAFNAAATAGLAEASRDEAEAVTKTALASAKAALSAADRLKDAEQISQAELLVNSALRAQQLLLERQNELRQQTSTTELDKQRQALIKLNAEQRKGLGEALDLRKKVNEAVQEGAPEYRVQELREAFESARDEALQGLAEFSKSNIVKLFGLENAAATIEETLIEGVRGLSLDWSNAVESLQTALTENEFQADVEVTAIINDESVSDIVRRIAAIGEARGGLPGEATDETAQGLRTFIVAQTELQNSIKQTGIDQKAAIVEAAAQLREANQFTLLGEGIKPQASDIVNAIGEPIFQAITQIDTASKAELYELQQNLIAAGNELNNTSVGLLGDITSTRFQKLQEGVSAALDGIQQRIQQFEAEAAFQPQGLEDAVEALRRLEDAAAQASIKAGDAADETAAIGDSAMSSDASVGTLASTTGTLAGAAEQAATAFRQMQQAALDALAAANAAKSAGSSEFAAFGGQVKYRAAGGDSRGQDTVPTMLNPEEFVVNAKSARNFLPQLNAINAGNVKGDMGSSDTNITIGDINVSSTSQLPSQTAREVGISIKRELRRGTFRL
ncbi:MAG: phage tail tape measure protein [bacterium]|nr:phage tail tape measure protein [bacterium]